MEGKNTPPGSQDSKTERTPIEYGVLALTFFFWASGIFSSFLRSGGQRSAAGGWTESS
jgi:hypothetical protein